MSKGFVLSYINSGVCVRQYIPDTLPEAVAHCVERVDSTGIGPANLIDGETYKVLGTCHPGFQFWSDSKASRVPPCFKPRTAP